MVMSSMANAIDVTDLSTAGFDKLSHAAKAELVKDIATKVAAKSTAEHEATSFANINDGLNQAQQWTDVGVNIGKALSGTVKELGVAVSDFASTSVGKLVTVLFVWHFFGHQVIHVVGGIFILLFGIYSVHRFRYMIEPTTITYSTTEKNIFGNFVVVDRRERDISSEMAFGMFFMYCIVFAVS